MDDSGARTVADRFRELFHVLHDGIVLGITTEVGRQIRIGQLVDDLERRTVSHPVRDDHEIPGSAAVPGR